MKHIDLTNVQESGSFNALPAGKYIATIQNVEDIANKEYLKVTYDIAEGEYAGYFEKQREHNAAQGWSTDWVGAYVKSYKEKALPMFKRFCSAVSKSNGAFVFDGNTVNSDEKTLIGKKMGIVLREEEYFSNSGDVKTRLIVHTECPIDKLDAQKVPDIKKLPDEDKVESNINDFVTVADGDAEENPFV